MPPVRGLQPTFAGGEFAPSLTARVDLQKYTSGLKKALNFFVHPHGGVSNRPGFRYIATAKYAAKKCRMIPFEFSTEQAYVIEFGHLYCRFYKDGGQILLSSAAAWSGATPYVVGDFVTYGGVKYICIQNNTNKQPDTETAYWTAQSVYEIPTPYTEDDLADLKFAQSADVLYICHPEFAPRTLARNDHDDWDLALYAFSNGPFMASNVSTKTLAVSATSGTGKTMTASADTFNALHVGSLWRLRHQVAGSTVNGSFTATGTTSSIACGGTWRFISHGTWTGRVKIEQSTDGGSTWVEIRSFSSANDFNANAFGDVDQPCLIRINCYSYTSGTCNADLSADPFEQTGIVHVTAYGSATSVTVDILTTLGATSATTDWAEGSWSDYRGWPTTVTFFQDRLAFGGSLSEPQTVWMTETSNYTGYQRNDPLEDSDGIAVNLASRKMNGIRNMVPLVNILTLTSASEFSVGAGQDGVLTPSSVATRQDGNRGCSKVDAVVVGNRAIYVQPQGTVVTDMGFDYSVNGFQGQNLSILSNHLFQGYTVVELAYQQEPDSLVWAVRSDGRLLSMTYMREHEVIAWTQHQTDGNVESACCIPGDGHDELWISVLRDNVRFVERMDPRMVSTDPRDQFFVDAGLTLDNPKTISGATKANPVVVTATGHGFSNGDEVDILNVEGMTELNGRRFIVANKAANTFELKDADTGANLNGTAFGTYVSGGEVRLVVNTVTGLSHLEGRTVAILANGSVQPQAVVSSGAVSLSPSASIVHVGLPYTCDFQTLRPEIPLKDGTMQGRKVRVAEVTVKFLLSRGGALGPNENKLKEIIQRSTEPMGSPIELFTGDKKQSITSDFENGGELFYRQSDPLPVTILSVVPKLEVGG